MKTILFITIFIPILIFGQKLNGYYCTNIYSGDFIIGRSCYTFLDSNRFEYRSLTEMDGYAPFGYGNYSFKDDSLNLQFDKYESKPPVFSKIEILDSTESVNDSVTISIHLIDYGGEPVPFCNVIISTTDIPLKADILNFTMTNFDANTTLKILKTTNKIWLLSNYVGANPAKIQLISNYNYNLKGTLAYLRYNLNQIYGARWNLGKILSIEENQFTVTEVDDKNNKIVTIYKNQALKREE